MSAIFKFILNDLEWILDGLFSMQSKQKKTFFCRICYALASSSKHNYIDALKTSELFRSMSLFFYYNFHAHFLMPVIRIFAWTILQWQWQRVHRYNLHHRNMLCECIFCFNSTNSRNARSYFSCNFIYPVLIAEFRSDFVEFQEHLCFVFDEF